MDYQIQQAIQDSIRENRTPVIEARIDTQEWVNLVNGLAQASDDWVRIAGGDSRINEDVVEVREYWGVDSDGDDWRIHVHATA
jgi:hypothetical protein